MVEIKGIEKFAPKDFLGNLSATVFVGGCNFRCPFCHNGDLVQNPEQLASFPADFFLSFLDSRKNWLEGICVSGGEPLLQEDLEVLLYLIKERGFLAKIDTNGSFPKKLQGLIREKLVDHIAMDIKAPLGRYEEAVGAKVRIGDIQESIEIIKSSGIPYTFRTTAVPGLLGEEDVKQMARELNGIRFFQLQQFAPHNTLDASYGERRPFSRKEMHAFAKIMEPYVSEIRIEGL